MATITDIQKQRRRETRYSVYLDGRYAFGLTDLELSTSGLRVGQSLSAADVAEFEKQAGQTKAYGLGVRYVAIRPRSRLDVAEYLKRRGYSGEAVVVVLERLGQLGLVDDQAFAAAWIANRQAIRPRSRRALAQELAAKGVARTDIESALGQQVGPEAEAAAAARIVAKKRHLPQYADAQKLTGYLLRQGFSYEAAQAALEAAENLGA